MIVYSFVLSMGSINYEYFVYILFRKNFFTKIIFFILVLNEIDPEYSKTCLVNCQKKKNGKP